MKRLRKEILVAGVLMIAAAIGVCGLTLGLAARIAP
ncbi:hypothetical protein OK074_6678 [Actinobacteria bacterium OK074]|nr:hypothetical protein OK074_8245 [Actinobacteria bacterium OK074]KPI30520.1 hypothetical protein OK074_6678 [Actinobacteria bacterium OK074]